MNEDELNLLNSSQLVVILASLLESKGQTAKDWIPKNASKQLLIDTILECYEESGGS